VGLVHLVIWLLALPAEHLLQFCLQAVANLRISHQSQDSIPGPPVEFQIADAIFKNGQLKRPLVLPLTRHSELGNQLLELVQGSLELHVELGGSRLETKPLQTENFLISVAMGTLAEGLIRLLCCA
jgi:hypothetical protein